MVLITPYRPAVTIPPLEQPHAVTATIGSVLVTPLDTMVLAAGGLELPAFFVATDGSDSNNGQSEAAAFLTISKARDMMRSDGTRSRVYIRGGTYSISSAISLVGTDSSTTYLDYPGETPIIDGGRHASSIFTGAAASGITLFGIKFTNDEETADCLSFNNSPNLLVEQCIFDTLERGILLGGTSTGALILDCTFTNLYHQGIRAQDGPNDGTVAGNNFTEIGISATHNENGNGVSVRQVTGWTVEFNDADGCDSAWLRLNDGGTGGLLNNTVRKNIVLNTSRVNSDQGAIYVLGRSNDNHSSNIDFNWIENVGNASETHAAGIYLDDTASGYTCQGNVIINVGEYAFHLHGGYSNIITNNISTLENTEPPGFAVNVVKFLFNQGSKFNVGPTVSMSTNSVTKNIMVSVDSSLNLASYGSFNWLQQSGTSHPGYAKPGTNQDHVRFEDIDADSSESSSTAADPQFTSVSTKDFELAGGSAAYTEGFVDIAGVTDTTGTGPPAIWGTGGYSRSNY